MNSHTILITIFILSFIYSVKSDDDIEVKRFGLSRARQEYRFNHPPSSQEYETIPVAIVYDKVIDSVSRSQKAVAPVMDTLPQVSSAESEDTTTVKTPTVDVAEVKRLGLSRARQGYRYNHPPSLEAIENTPITVTPETKTVSEVISSELKVATVSNIISSARHVVDNTPFDLNKVKQEYQFNHTPTTEDRVNTSAPVVHSKELDTQLQKTVTPAAHIGLSERFLEDKDTSAARNTQKFKFGDKIRSTNIPVTHDVITIDDINKPISRKLKLSLKIPVSVVYDEESENLRGNRIMSGVTTRLFLPYSSLGKFSNQSDDQTQFPVKSLSDNNENDKSDVKAVNRVIKNPPFQTQTNKPVIDAHNIPTKNGAQERLIQFTNRETSNLNILSQNSNDNDVKPVSDESFQKTSLVPPRKIEQLNTVNKKLILVNSSQEQPKVERNGSQLRENNSRRQIRTKQPKTDSSKISTENTDHETGTEKNYLERNDPNIPVHNGIIKANVKPLNNSRIFEKATYSRPSQVNISEINVNRPKTLTNNTRYRGHIKYRKLETDIPRIENISQYKSRNSETGIPKAENVGLYKNKNSGTGISKIENVGQFKPRNTATDTPKTENIDQYKYRNSETDIAKAENIDQHKYTNSETGIPKVENVGQYKYINYGTSISKVDNVDQYKPRNTEIDIPKVENVSHDKYRNSETNISNVRNGGQYKPRNSATNIPKAESVDQYKHRNSETGNLQHEYVDQYKHRNSDTNLTKIQNVVSERTKSIIKIDTSNSSQPLLTDTNNLQKNNSEMSHSNTSNPEAKNLKISVSEKNNMEKSKSVISNIESSKSVNNDSETNNSENSNSEPTDMKTSIFETSKSEESSLKTSYPKISNIEEIKSGIRNLETSYSGTIDSKPSKLKIPIEIGSLHNSEQYLKMIGIGNPKVSAENEEERNKGSIPIQIVPIIASENIVHGNTGEFRYSYENGDGTRAFSKGNLKTFDEEVTGYTAGEAVEGAFSYKDKDGNSYSLSYTADENGYRPIGAHLPTPPPIPPAIARALEYLATKTTPEPVTEAIEQENTSISI